MTPPRPPGAQASDRPPPGPGWARAPVPRSAARGAREPCEALPRRFLGPAVGSVSRLDTVRERYPTAALAQLTPDLLARLRAEGEDPL